MSMSNVKAFFQQLQTDEVLKSRLKGLNVTNKQEATEALILIARDAGFPFTAEQYEESTRTHQGPPAQRRIEADKT